MILSFRLSISDNQGMEIRGMKLSGLDDLDSPGPQAGKAEVLEPVKEPIPNMNTIEGVIEGHGLLADSARRKGGWLRVGVSAWALYMAISVALGSVFLVLQLLDV
jgi:hypothetical protein